MLADKGPEGAGAISQREGPKRMNLLVVSYMLPPVLTPQSIQIGRLLANLDAEIMTVSGPLTAMGPVLEAANLRARRARFQIEIAFTPAFSGLALSLAKRLVPLYGAIPDEFRGWVGRACAATLANLEETGFRPDVIATFGEPMSDHLVGLRLKRRLGVPWVAHCSDPWADNPFRAGQFLANRLNRHLEAQVIEAADRVVFTSAETRELVMRKYPANWRGKCAVLGHSFDPSLYPEATRPQRSIVVRHVGSFYGQRTPLPLLRALKLMDPRQLEDVRFELVGRTPPWLRFHPAWRALPAGLVVCEGAVDYARALALMAQADLLLVIDAPSELSIFLPSKLVEYLGARVPLMGITPPGTAASLLHRLGGIVADPSDTRQVAAALERALAVARERRAGPHTPWGNGDVRAAFTVERIAQEFTRLLADAAGVPAHRPGAFA